MRIAIYVLSLLLTFLLPLEVYAEEKAPPPAEIKIQETAEAPFGLKWGMSEVDAKAMGVTLTKMEKEGEGKQFTATGLSKVLSDTEIVFLHFGYNDKLWLVIAISKSFDNDPYGGSVSARYDDLSKLLGAKYGNGEVSHIQDHRLYSAADEFLAGIQNGRSIHFSTFKKQGVSVELSIGANSYDSGYYRLRYENVALAKDYGKDKKQHEGDAL